MRLLFFLPAILLSLFLSAQNIHIIPKPQKMELRNGSFSLTPETVILASDNNTQSTIQFFNQHLKTYYGFELKTVKTASSNFIQFTLKPGVATASGEQYQLEVTGNSMQLNAHNPAGLFYSMQTLIQLLPVENLKSKTGNQLVSIPQLYITDAPRFQYRGMHLDIGRHFQPISFIKRYIDFLAYHKLNKFHWHLTEDQGWRIEIKQYPELTSIGSKRNGTIIGRYPGKGNNNQPHSGYYTQEEIKEVVQYAKERFIEVIPEIEMPGHSSAAIAAYPWLSCFPNKPTEIPANMISKKSIEEQKNGRIKLVQETWGVFDDVFCAGNDSVFLFLQNVIDEVTALFPSNYFHIGGDECPKTHWKQCSKCQQRMKDLKLKDEHELQSYFVQRIEKYLNSKGKTLIGWDEILEGGLAPNAIVMSWRGETGGIEAAKQKHQVIMTPGKPVYFDHSQSKNEDSVTIGGYNPIEAVYAYNPVPKELNADEAKYVLGAQANVWTEYMNNTRKIEYMIFPRMAALSEVLWSGKENRNWKEFQNRLQFQLKCYERMGWNYSKAYYDLSASVLPTPDQNGVYWKLESKNERGSIGYSAGNQSLEVTYKNAIIVNSSTVFTARYYNENKIVSSLEQKFSFSKSTGKQITLTHPPSNSYPGDGAFTLVNGVVNEKGLARSQEFLGFSGTDCEAVIDLGTTDTLNQVTAHVFSQISSWIWPPETLTVEISTDGKKYTPVVDVGPPIKRDDNKLQLNFRGTAGRYVKVKIPNKGGIPEGNPGAGNKAWLFVSEIQLF
jgi:hexosaminidase